MTWGYHLSLDCYDANKDSIKDYDTVYKFTKELVKEIDMKAYGEPQIIHFGEGDKEGFTLVQLIETSNICAHFCNDSGNFYLDVFSCKHFPASVVESVVQNHFSPNQIVARFVTRE